MHEAVSFPVARCSHCAVDVVVFADLDDGGELLERCTRCGAAIGADAARKRFGVTSLKAMGYTFDDDDGGCGSGGCSSCGSKATSPS